MLLLPAIAPLSLARVARGSSTRSALFLFPILVGIHAGTIGPLAAGISEPFGSLDEYLALAWRGAAGIALFIMIAVAAAEFAAWANGASVSRIPGGPDYFGISGLPPHAGPETRVVLLSPLTTLLPTIAL